LKVKFKHFQRDYDLARNIWNVANPMPNYKDTDKAAHISWSEKFLLGASNYFYVKGYTKEEIDEYLNLSHYYEVEEHEVKD
jgi:hypothetical protein